MADVPVIRNQADFVNHVIATLNGSLQQWRFTYLHRTELIADVRFANGRSGRISWTPFRGLAYSDDSGNLARSDWLTARLNGLKRDDLGNMVPRRPGASLSPAAKGDGE